VAAVVLTICSATPAAAVPGPPSAPEYWFLSWQVPRLWALGARGQGVTIAEIDTGVTAALPQLSGRVLPGRDFGRPGNGQIDRSTSPFGHGTAMASIMVGRRGPLGITGLAPAAKVLPVAVPLDGTTDASSNDHLPRAIRWAVDHGAKIITMSLGGAQHSSGDTDACPDPEQKAVYYALAHGVAIFAAGGNRGQIDNAVEEPGVCLGVVSVGAVDRSGRVAAFSSRHRYLTMTAPGVNIPSLGREAGAAFAGDGTSQATALTAAAAALVWSRYPRLPAQRVVARLLATLGGHRTETRRPATEPSTPSARSRRVFRGPRRTPCSGRRRRSSRALARSPQPTPARRSRPGPIPSSAATGSVRRSCAARRCWRRPGLPRQGSSS
jgi:subtilisin family serine protease